MRAADAAHVLEHLSEEDLAEVVPAWIRRQ
jgi:hypothetical protein